MLLYLILLFCVPCVRRLTDGKKRVLKRALLYTGISLLAGAWHAADAVAQPRPGIVATAEQNVAVGDVVDFAVTLRDPFSPIGYHLPMSGWQTSATNVLAVPNVPPPSVNLKAKAKALLRVRGIVRRGNNYVANVNGAIVKAGDEIEVAVDGQRVAFIIRAISLKRIEIEVRE